MQMAGTRVIIRALTKISIISLSFYFHSILQLASEDTQFDTYTNDMWHVRHAALDKFAQAARKVWYS